MSKLTKLINHPDKFFKDFIIKRIDLVENLLGSNQKNFIVEKTIIENSPTDSFLETEKVKVNAKNPVKIVEKISFNFNALIYAEKITTLIHCGEGLAVGTIICKDWIQYIYDIRKNVVLVVRSLDLYTALIKEFSHVNIVYAKSPTDLEILLNKLEYLKQICYVSNTSNNIHLIRFNQYKHIFCGNFDLQRQPNAHKFFRVYDEIWVNSQFNKETMESNFNNRHLKVINVGNPKANSLNFKIKKIKKIYFNFNDNLEISQSGILFFMRNHEYLLENYSVYIEKNNSKSLNDLEKYCKNNDLDVEFDNFEKNISLFDALFLDYKNDVETEEFSIKGIPVFCFKPENLDLINPIENSLFFENIIKFNSLADFSNIVNELESNKFFLENYENFLEYRFGCHFNSKKYFLSNVKNLLSVENKCELE